MRRTLLVRYLIIVFICLCLCLVLAGCGAGKDYGPYSREFVESLGQPPADLMSAVRAVKISEEFDVMLYPIVYPTLDFLIQLGPGGRVAREQNDVAVVEYFRDHDFSREMGSLEELWAEIEEIKPGESLEQRFSRGIRVDLDNLRLLVALGRSYQGREVIAEDLSMDERQCIDNLWTYSSRLELMAELIER